MLNPRNSYGHASNLSNVFQERSLAARLDENSLPPKNLSFNMATWSQGGLRYFVIGDASAADINNLTILFKTTGS